MASDLLLHAELSLRARSLLNRPCKSQASHTKMPPRCSMEQYSRVSATLVFAGVASRFSGCGKRVALASTARPLTDKVRRHHRAKASAERRATLARLYDTKETSIIIQTDAPPNRSRGSIFGMPIWMASLLEPSLGNKARSSICQELLAALQRDILKCFCSPGPDFSHSEQALPSMRHSSSTLNHSFFQRQLAAHRTVLDGTGNEIVCAQSLAESRAFLQLATVLRQSTVWFLRDCCCLGNADVQHLVQRPILTWASAHGHGSSHGYHIHHDSLLSGVFYLQVPPGSGALVVGPGVVLTENEVLLPSCNRRCERQLQPAAGDLVVFPSWMPHRVAPSSNSQALRLSISFNLSGQWEELAQLCHDI
eukprot:TRINITY_DN38772_c0_g1_i1.p1 TRINITY_DN38772_c0_g1~~TRINITY_DN38772_c0_g1_i1.p1  ORF type:complete len:365 (-),score=46.01 TRINITY_DN38772_c0_g1_i1:71-1165(-)